MPNATASPQLRRTIAARGLRGGLILAAILALAGMSLPPAIAQGAGPSSGPTADYESEPDLAGLLAATKGMRMAEIEPGLAVGVAAYPPYGVRIHVFDFAQSRFALRIGEQKAATGSRAADFLDDKDEVLVINGGYFERSRAGRLSSSGLLIVDGQATAREHDRAGSGVIYAGPEGVGIVYRKDFRDRSGVGHALQVGPILVDPGGVKGIYNNVGGRFNRSAVCLRDGSFTAFVVEGGISLFQLADLLSLPRRDGGFGCDVAINLDGGPSTQATLRAGSTLHDIPGGTAVHNVLIVSRK
jgi:uncharacterized protein YigE (DUF2233 family)